MILEVIEPKEKVELDVTGVKEHAAAMREVAVAIKTHPELLAKQTHAMETSLVAGLLAGFTVGIFLGLLLGRRKTV